MKSKLIATTALAAVLAFGAAPVTFVYAQQERQPATVFNPDAKPYENQGGYYNADPTQILASDLIGKTVYSSAADDAETVGDVNDVIMNPSGRAQAIIIGVGGFLGLGEKDVAIDFAQVNWQVGEDGERVLTTALDKESLENAPAFDYAALEREYNRLTLANRERMANDSVDPAAGGAAAVRQDDQAGQTDMAQNREGGAEVVVIEPGQQGAQGQQQAAQGQQQTGNQAAEGQNQQMAAGQDQNRQAAQTGEAMQGQSVDPNAMQTVQMEEITAERVTGATVYSADNEEIGEVSEVLLTNDGQVSGFVVDIGGFLGMGERQVELKANEMKFSQDQDGNLAVWTDMSRQQLEQMPERQS